MACEQAAYAISPHRSTKFGFHPQDVTSVAVNDSGRAAAVIEAGYIVYAHTSQVAVVSHQVHLNVVGTAALYVDANHLEAVPGTDERAGASVVVTTGVG